MQNFSGLGLDLNVKIIELWPEPKPSLTERERDKSEESKFHPTYIYSCYYWRKTKSSSHKYKSKPSTPISDPPFYGIYSDCQILGPEPCCAPGGGKREL
jgi:hypothetical protein